MTNNDQLFHSLNTPDSPAHTRATFVSTLKQLGASLDKNPNNMIDIAYSIAGLMATSYAQSLSPDDPIDEILTIAGELEVNPNNATSLCQELAQKINDLV